MSFISKIKTKLKNNIREYVSTEELVERGMVVGDNFFRGKNVEIDLCSWLIEIGNNVTLTPNVTLLTHDASMRRTLGIYKIGNIKIGDNVFVGVGSIILPGVTIGDNIVIGAGSIISKDLESNYVYAGNPAKKICTMDEFLDRHKDNNKKIYDEGKTLKGNMTKEEKELMKKNLMQNGIAYVR